MYESMNPINLLFLIDILILFHLFIDYFLICSYIFMIMNCFILLNVPLMMLRIFVHGLLIQSISKEFILIDGKVGFGFVSSFTSFAFLYVRFFVIYFRF